MLKLWLVIYIAGKVASTLGPLPVSLAECERKAIEYKAGLNPNLKTDGVTAKDIEFVCEAHRSRPVLER